MPGEIQEHVRAVVPDGPGRLGVAAVEGPPDGETRLDAFRERVLARVRGVGAELDARGIDAGQDGFQEMPDRMGAQVAGNQAHAQPLRRRLAAPGRERPGPARGGAAVVQGLRAAHRARELLRVVQQVQQVAARLQIFRRERQGLAEAGQGLGQPAGFLEDHAEIVVGLGEPGIAGQRRAAALGRFVEPVGVAQDRREVAPQPRVVRGQRERAAQAAFRGGGPPQRVPGASEVGVAFRKVRRDQDGALQNGLGLGRTAQVQQDAAQGDERPGVARQELRGLAAAGQGLVRPAQGQEHGAQMAPGRAVLRMQRREPAAAEFGLVQAALRGQKAAQLPEGSGQAGVERQGLPTAGLGRVRALRGPPADAQVEVRLGVLRREDRGGAAGGQGVVRPAQPLARRAQHLPAERVRRGAPAERPRGFGRRVQAAGEEVGDERPFFGEIRRGLFFQVGVGRQSGQQALRAQFVRRAAQHGPAQGAGLPGASGLRQSFGQLERLRQGRAFRRLAHGLAVADHPAGGKRAAGPYAAVSRRNNRPLAQMARA